MLLLVDKAASFENVICNYYGCVVDMSVGGVIVMSGWGWSGKKLYLSRVVRLS